MKHLLSQTALWKTTSEFIDAKGNKSIGTGESFIQVNDPKITNRSWAEIDGEKRENNYVFHKISDTRYEYTSQNPELGIQEGYYDIHENIIFSKFRLKDTGLNGFEIIKCENDICFAYGALYINQELINTWTAEMILQTL